VLPARALLTPRHHWRKRLRVRRRTSERSFPYNLRFPGQVFGEPAGLHQNYFRDYDPAIGKYVESDPIGLTGGTNTYGFAGLNPIVHSDASGLDYRIEGPNQTEPIGHQSLCVGNPLGGYRCFSFGVNGSCCLQGEVYEDLEPGGEIKASAYRKTNAAEDYAILQTLQKQLGVKSQYLPWNTCRDFSIQNFLALARQGVGTPAPPPKRTPGGLPTNSPRTSSTDTNLQ
jgi:RHS repeat-associated protein